MSEHIELRRVDPAHEGRSRGTGMDVVFIHGLGGDWDATWRFDKHCWWPQWLADEHPTVQVWCLGYPAKSGHLAALTGVRQVGSAQLAAGALAHLRDHRIGQRPCIFVCHSLGGLVAKQMLLEANQSEEMDRFQHDNVAAVMFLGTPHRGSAVADFLKGLERFKNAIPDVIAAVFGASSAVPGARVLTSSELISELKTGAVGLQHLNETFGLYFAQRHQTNPLQVRVFGETQALKVKGVSTVVVVDKDSTNPNLHVRADSAPISVVLVQDADHSSLVKLQTRGGEVWASLRYLIQEVGHERGNFIFDDPLRNEVARAIHLLSRERPVLLHLAVLAAQAKGSTDAERAHNLAESLAGANCDAVPEAIASLKTAMYELADKAGASLADVAALEQVAGWLAALVTAGRPDSSTAPLKPDAAAEFKVPLVGEVEDADARAYLSLTIEVCHAALRKWPTRWQLAAEGSAVLSNAWVMQSEAASHPSSWHNQDHLKHLQERIVASAAEGRRPKGLMLKSGPTADQQRLTSGGDAVAAGAASGAPARAQLAMQMKAESLLKSRFKDKNSLIINAAHAGSAYQTDTLRAELARLFGPLVALALPEAIGADTDSFLMWLIVLQTELQQFMIAAEETRNRVQTHAR